jgi:hypothetical protein
MTDTVSQPEPSRGERAGLQAGHRAGSAALLLLAIGAGAFFAHKPHLPLLLLAFACADVGLVGAFLSLVLARRSGCRGGEALGTVVFCAAVLLITLALIIASHLREHD